MAPKAAPHRGAPKILRATNVTSGISTLCCTFLLNLGLTYNINYLSKNWILIRYPKDAFQTELGLRVSKRPHEANGGP